jgi:type IV secretory pathway TraG/TraD family ATPase VirD4
MELNIRPGTPGFKHQMETTSDGRVTRTALEEKSYAFFFNANDQAIAEDVSKAFADASIICRFRVKRTQ